MNKPKAYVRLNKADRISIERGLASAKSCRQIALDIERFPSTVCDEVKHNKTITKGSKRGNRVEDVAVNACYKLQQWPHVCNGYRSRPYNCSYKWGCEYSAACAHVKWIQLLGLNAIKNAF